MDYLSKLIDDLINDTRDKKYKVVLEALSMHGVNVSLTEEAERRFKSIAVVTDQRTGTEEYYYNDGTKDGLKLVTFYLQSPTLEDNQTVSFKYSYTYIIHEAKANRYPNILRDHAKVEVLNNFVNSVAVLVDLDTFKILKNRALSFVLNNR